MVQPQDNSYHVPVMLREVMDALAIQPEGLYVDCTLGGAGHARELLRRLGPEGRLIAFDQDADARANLPDDPRVLFLPHNFRHMQRFLRLHEAIPVDGILADLGVSSHQIDVAERGFSTRFEGDLDMRMDRRQPRTAADIVRHRSAEELHKLFEKYGEVTNARTLARRIVEVRKVTPLRTTADLKLAIQDLVRGNPHKYFAQVFQALRIAVNEEEEALKEWLQQVPEVLRIGGRVVCLTFHSLEDRLVKRFFRYGRFEEPGQNLPGTEPPKPRLRPVFKKPLMAGSEELKNNPRARSAKMRVAEKTA